MSLIDVLVIALIGALVASRFLKFKLPKDDRPAAQKRADLEKLRHLWGERPVDPAAPKQGQGVTEVMQPAREKPLKEVGRSKAPSAPDAKNLIGVAKIAALDPSFVESDFLAGARAAYGYFYACWNAKDEAGMDNLCAPTLLNRVVGEWRAADYAPVVVDEVTDARISTARVTGKTAIVEVAFTAVHRVGSAVPRPVRSTWVMARAMNSEDPNWELQDQREQADA
jgi:predicted lipid-binding transport protein (Tim44 family)